jgi:hypothetical protein
MTYQARNLPSDFNVSRAAITKLAPPTINPYLSQKRGSSIITGPIRMVAEMEN